MTVREVLEELGWTSYSALGHSMRGLTALRISILMPHTIRSIVAISPVTPAGPPVDEATLEAFSAL
ncbi:MULTISPECIES: hypothetical protein [unclassified Rhodococcus (in: high G+C Gram-positive bacteria)]|uniref:hypothetical protein n=1 Tax=unclassified Rhodococcus (in: high G+C Gram-positive bacteria) TaxID=192944 RepID=UPI00163AE5BF|nr:MULTISPECIES: hypothetical protein [unclassified Rhodococcus (in: high G+C Gram-positive bacteria)]MBC2637927.1 hypothetical protein [Rhodococcus sp. 3A]MBC2897326.1 hypothetical protein [Rhodococcus sp. 4CII]